MNRLFFLCCSLSTLFNSYTLHADTTTQEQEEPLPWLTGPLLTPSSHVIPTGHYNIEPYVFATSNYGAYNKNWKALSAPHNLYNVQAQVPVQIGMPANLDFMFVPQWSWNHIKGASHWVLNDLPFGFDYQIVARERHDWWPSVKFSIRGNFPIGKYQKLNVHNKGTDVGGSGSWLPAVGLTMSHLVHISGPVFLSPRAYFQYTIPTPVHVKKLNAYGGGEGTKGKVFPGQQLLGQIGLELSLPMHFALACDFQYQHVNKDRFKGRKGATNGVPNRIGPPSSEQFIIAPAVEYNWSAFYGVIAGAQFTAAGRNAGELVSGVVAINVYH